MGSPFEDALRYDRVELIRAVLRLAHDYLDQFGHWPTLVEVLALLKLPPPTRPDRRQPPG